MTPLETFQNLYPDLEVSDLLSRPGIRSESEDHLFFLHDRTSGYQWGLMAFLTTPSWQKIHDALSATKALIQVERQSQPISGILRSNCPMARTYESAIEFIPSAYQAVFNEVLIEGEGQNPIEFNGRTTRLGSLFLRTRKLFLMGQFISI